MKDATKSILYTIFGIAAFIGVWTAIVFVIEGGAWFVDRYGEIFGAANLFVLGIMFVFALLAIDPKMRSFAGQWMVIGSYVMGAIFWIASLYVTYALWGLPGVIIGVFLLGIGVFFTATLAALFSGEFLLLFGLIIWGVMVWGVRLFGMWLTSKAGERELRRYEYGSEEISAPIQYCSKCGYRLEDEARFCVRCGAEIK